MFSFLGLITVILAFATAQNSKFLEKKPDYLTPCALSQPDFNKCYTQNVQVVFHEWKDGIPGLKAYGSIDPLHVKRVIISQNGFSAELTNIIVKGGSNVIVRDASFDAKALVTQIKLFAPKLNFASDYKVNGKILNLSLNSSGKSKMDIEKFGVLLTIHLKLRNEHGYTFTDIESLKLSVTEIGSVKVHFDNLFNGQKDLEDATNDLLNENWQDFYEVLRPAVSSAVEAVMKDRLTKAFAYVPGDYIIKDLPKST